MPNKSGYATYKKGKLYFDAVGWAMIREVARRTKKSARRIVLEGLKRGMRLAKRKKSR